VKPFDVILGLGAAFIAGLVPLYGLVYVLYLVISLPLRRQERARLFLDLIETGLTRGQSMEQTVVSVSHTEDDSVGIRFHLLAAYIESGWTVPRALEKVPGLLPPALTAMLAVGVEIGDPRRVLPACRTLLRDATSHLQSAYNYFVVLLFVLIPVIPALFWVMSVFVIPKYQAIFADLLEGAALPNIPFRLASVLSEIQIAIALCFYVAAVCYVGGPRLLSWISAGVTLPKFHWLLSRIPWRKKRMQRDFAAMLGVLLDAGIPEDRAVVLAAGATANDVFIRRGEAVVTQLRAGVPLTQALAKLDNDGEFRWRLGNALHNRRNFFASLSGWLESLDARAFRQQQSFAQLITTGLVVYNGMMVALFAVFIFRAFNLVIEEGLSW
jgi:type II secretory pathway component PulF